MTISKNGFLCLLLFCFSISQAVLAQAPNNPIPKPQISTYYDQKLSNFQKMPIKPHAIVFLGNSITDGNEWAEMFGNSAIINRGISGDITAGVFYRMDEVLRHNPDKIFLLIGVNDLSRNIQPDSILKNMYQIADYVHRHSQHTQLFMQSILPVSDHYKMFAGHTGKGAEIKFINNSLAQNAERLHYTYIDLYTYFANENGKLRNELSNDGLHLNGDGYLLWKNIISSYVQTKVNELPLIPFPKEVHLGEQFFNLKNCKNIIAPKVLAHEAQVLKNALQNTVNLTVASQGEGNIHLVLDSNMTQKEGYKLHITTDKITLTAQNHTGIFYGIQTLLQLQNNGNQIPTCSITDAPAFEWRGYMIDVGRNYQSVATIKKQIEKMAFYKYNVFHFHLTEDVAWRLAIKKYPQLTAAKNMTRNEGKFYSEAEIKDLMQFCEARHILFLPEIDMPGHSKAFERAFGCSMQSVKGLEIVKNILTEVLDTYHFKYLHIGGDEVKITDKAFLPTVSKLIRSKGCEVMGWNPGGNLLPGTIQQLWMRDIPNGKVVDSRHAYINHFDPEESVITLFQRKFLKANHGDAHKLGAELCLWHDRKQNDEQDNFKMNPVYPSMMAFAERIWNGGGVDSIVAFLDPNRPEVNGAFEAFEQRLLTHKAKYFKSDIFNYVQQSQIHWKLIGPYENNGDLSKVFEPEQSNFNFSGVQNAVEAQGATVVLRHFWPPFISGLLSKPKENTTWYAYTKYWSDVDTVAQAWIGAYDMSRSYFSTQIQPYQWNDLQTKFMVNGAEIRAPNWTLKKTGDLEVPFTDEGYSYRKPTQVRLKKGWNEILVKLPVGSFQSKLWYEPVKWEFTFTLVKEGNGSQMEALPGVYSAE